MVLEVPKPERFTWNRLIGCEVVVDGKQDWIVGIAKCNGYDLVFNIDLQSGKQIDIFDCMFYIDDETLASWVEYHNYFYGEKR